jgi:hypothetical protein
MVHKREDRLHVLSKALADLNGLQKRSTALDIEVKKELVGISPELVVDYEGIASKAELGSFFPATIDYNEQIKSLLAEASEIFTERVTGNPLDDLFEKLDYTRESIEKSIVAKEKLKEQIHNMGKKDKQMFLVYSTSNLDSITRSYIESPDSTLCESLSKYKMDKLIIYASCEGMMHGGEYSNVMLRYKTFASSYKRIMLDDTQMRKARELLKNGRVAELINGYVSDMYDIFNANIVPRVLDKEKMIELASETYYYEDYSTQVRQAQGALMKEILKML